MRFVASSKELAAGAALPAKLAAKRNTIIALSYLRLEVKTENEPVLYITGSTGDVFFTSAVSLSPEADNEEGATCVDAKLFCEGVKKIADQPLTMELAGGNVEVSFLAGTFSVPAYPADEYPMPYAMGAARKEYEIDSGIADHLIQAPKFVLNGDLRPVMACVCLSITERDGGTGCDWEFCASSGHVLYKAWHGEGHRREGSPLLFPASMLKAFKAIRNSGTFHIETDGHVMTVSGDEGDRATFTLVDATYPNYDRVINSEEPAAIVTVDSKEMCGVLDRATAFASKDIEHVKLVFSPEDGLTVEANDGERQVSYHEKMRDADVSGEGMTVAFNGGMLMQTLSSVVPEGIAVICFWTPDKSVIISPEDAEKRDRLGLQMPLAIRDI